MKRILVFIVVILSFAIGACIYAIGESESRMKDEYWYTLKILHVLFEIEEGESSEAIYELNNLLYAHIDRNMVARSLTPSFLSDEIDLLMCANFQFSSENLNKFKSFIIKENLYSYIEEKVEFCPDGTLVSI